MGKRMYYILEIFLKNDNEFFSAKEIQQKFLDNEINISLNYIRKIIGEINDFFFPLFHDDLIVSFKKKGYQLSQCFFDDAQLQLLLDSVMYHEDLNSKDKEELKDKLLLLSPSTQQARLIVSDRADKSLNFSLFLNLNTIMKAIDEQKKITFEYIDYRFDNHHFMETSKKKNPPYMISPYQIVLNNNHYYVLGYYEPRVNELSIYRIDRMRMIQIRRKHIVDIRDQFDMKEKMKKMMNMYTNSQIIDLTIEYHQSIVREVISRFSIDIEVEKKQAKWYQSTIYDIELTDGLIGWLMMLQDNIKVISPYSLKMEMRQRIHQMADLYEEE